MSRTRERREVRRCNQCGRGAGIPNLCQTCHAKAALDPLHEGCAFPGCNAWSPPVVTKAVDDACIDRSESKRLRVKGCPQGKRPTKVVAWSRVVVALFAAAAVACSLAFAFSGCSASGEVRAAAERIVVDVEKLEVAFSYYRVGAEGIALRSATESEALQLVATGISLHGAVSALKSSATAAIEAARR